MHNRDLATDNRKKAWREHLKSNSERLNLLKSLEKAIIPDNIEELAHWQKTLGQLKRHILTYDINDGFAYKTINETFNDMDNYLSEEFKKLYNLDQERFHEIVDKMNLQSSQSTATLFFHNKPSDGANPAPSEQDPAARQTRTSQP